MKGSATRARTGAAELVSVQDAADLLGTSVTHVRQLVGERRIAHVRIGPFIRLDGRDIEEFIRAGRVEPLSVRRPGLASRR